MQQNTTANEDPTPHEAAQIQASTRKRTNTTKSTTTKSISGAVKRTKTSTTAPIVPTEINEPTASTTHPQTPEAPTTSRIIPTAEKIKAIPFTAIKKQPRGRPPKSKSSNNNDENESEPTEQIQLAIDITQSSAPVETIDPTLLSKDNMAKSMAPVTRSRAYLEQIRRQRIQAHRQVRTRSQDSDEIPLPRISQLPQINMTMEDNNVILSSTASYRELNDNTTIDSEGYTELLNSFHPSQGPRAAPIKEEEKEDDLQTYNTHKSKDEVMATFLRDPRALRASVIAIQEPWRNELNNTTHQPASLTHQLLYPKPNDNNDNTNNNKRARMALFVNKSINPASWSHTVISPDYQILHIHYQRCLHSNSNSEPHDLYIHNIYNEPRSTTFTHIDRELTRLGCSQTTAHIVLGDMNAHHPAWGGPGTKIDEQATELLEIMDRHGIELATEEGLVTWERGQSQSTIDLTFLSTTLFHRLVLHERADEIQHDSDHWPIRMQIDIDTPTHEPPRRRNWAAIDIKVLQELLSQLIAPRLINTSKSHIKLATVAFTAAIRKAVDQSVPWARPSAWSNPDFTPECKEAVRTCRQLRRQFSNTHNPWIWRAYLRARNKKKRLVKKSLRLGHRRCVQQATEQGPLGL
ncbi:hypothetical protein TSTA_040250 [Talaromyces stipitatus ATCC 10500]|uniref:Endonuclease/exonuclease/phosphatase domain-containing protein n=1 Tax=Talaromyces stipitatus (strain ATCC 10500 / CBS 375.48 / QM 6759 / NRRL 1006) TaxID=441959 RepID=B8M488_TALSN|nr:uncharacterized protein TSTA_040250 [Talaromyces stipitatus ATCC 10500]EED20831.1 hypothetical protein TSTA_040250 [Talaromyces stipitatus ATCC 10500]